MAEELTYTLVERESQLPELLAWLETAAEIAVDSEADSMHSYFEKTCLLQLSAGPRNFLVDPLAGFDLAPLLALLARKQLLFHGADYDLRMLRQGYGFRPGPVPFDTMLAAQLIGCPRIGLAALVESCCGVVMVKDEQRSDWSRRPLTQSQLDYAAADTHYLPQVVAWCRSELARLGRSEWHRESCAALVEATATDRPVDTENAWRIKGLKDFSPRALAFVREIWWWRDAQARAADIPPFKILNDAGLLALVEHLGQGANLRDFRLPRHIVGKRLSELREALQRAAALPDEQCPQPPPRSFQGRDLELEARTDKLRAAAAKIAKELAIEPPVLASRARLEALAKQLPADRASLMTAGPLLGWQADLLAPAVRELTHPH